MLQAGLEPASMEWATRLNGSGAHVLIFAPRWIHILTIVFPYKSAPPLTRQVWEHPTAAQLCSEPPPPSAPSWHPHQWDYNDHFWWTQHLHMGKKHVLTKLYHILEAKDRVAKVHLEDLLISVWIIHFIYSTVEVVVCFVINAVNVLLVCWFETGSQSGNASFRQALLLIKSDLRRATSGKSTSKTVTPPRAPSACSRKNRESNPAPSDRIWN